MSKHTTRALALMAVGALMFTAACTTRNDGGTPTTEPTGGATTSSGGEAPAEFTVAFVPKIQGIPYFEAMNAGGKKAEEVIPGLKWEYQGPTTADPAAQADVVDAVEMVEAVEAEAAEAVEMAEQADGEKEEKTS